MPVIFVCSVRFPGGSEVKASACNVGDLGSIPGSGRSPGEGNSNPKPGESHGQKSLVGYSPQGHKESGTTERLSRWKSLSIHLSISPNGSVCRTLANNNTISVTDFYLPFLVTNFLIFEIRSFG